MTGNSTPSTAPSFDQEGGAAALAIELADVLRRMADLNGIGERRTSSVLSAMPDAKALGDRLASIGFAFGAGVDHIFGSWHLRLDPDEDDPEGEIQTDAALAIMMLNEVVRTGRKRGASEETLLLADCSDVFAWGCSDVEILPHDQVDDVFRHWEKDPMNGVAVWCMKRRRELPQAPVLRRIREGGLWDIDELVSKHALRPNRYDAFSGIHSEGKRIAYAAWRLALGRDAPNVPEEWWKGWTLFATANAGWYNAEWIRRERRQRDDWAREAGYEVDTERKGDPVPDSTVTPLVALLQDGERVRSMVDDALHSRFIGSRSVDWNKDGHGNVDHPVDVMDVVECMTELIMTLPVVATDQSTGDRAG